MRLETAWATSPVAAALTATASAAIATASTVPTHPTAPPAVQTGFPALGLHTARCGAALSHCQVPTLTRTRAHQAHSDCSVLPPQ